jgi:hypothetical protein
LRNLPIFAGLALGLALAYAAMPAIFRAVPSDLSGTATVVEALHTTQPKTVVFGDSRGQADVDARLLGGVNLSTPDQTLEQMVLLMDGLPKSVERVVIVVPPEDEGIAIAPTFDTTLWMDGLRPSLEARHTVRQCTGTMPLTRGEIEQRFAARWTLRQALETLVRTRIRPTDNIYATRVDDARFTQEAAIVRSDEVVVTPRTRCLLAALSGTAGRRYRVVFVVPPIHSSVVTRGYLDYASRAGVPILDFTRAMPDDAFADPRHLTHAGARAFTLRLAEALR